MNPFKIASILLFGGLGSLACHSVVAQTPSPLFHTFDESIPAELKADKLSKLSLTGERAILGPKSLRWEWQPGAVLTFKQPVEVKQTEVDGMPASSTIGFWVYNNTPRPEVLRITFYQGGEPAGHYDFALNFQGWRTSWVRLDLDLVGAKSGVRQFDSFTLAAPIAGAPGVLLIDELVPSWPTDRRYAVPDYQVTSHNPTWVMKEWIGSRRVMDLQPVDRTPPTVDEISATRLVAKRMDAVHRRHRVTDEAFLTSLRVRFAKINLRELPDGTVTGAYIPIQKEEYIYPPERHVEFMRVLAGSDLWIVAKLFRDLADGWHAGTPEQRAEIGRMYVLLSRHMLDLGWAEGSGRGFHGFIGYPIRDYCIANFLMRDVLAEAGLLGPISRMMQFYTNARRCVEPPPDGDLDYQHTIASIQLLTLSMVPDDVERALFMRAFSHGLDKAVAFCSDDALGGYKRDGTAFHHWGHYPAYANGALNNSAQLLEWFADTPFRLSPAAYENLGRAILSTRIYSNRYAWPNGVSGRHPFSDGASIHPIRSAFLNLALAGSPDGVEPVNREAAAASLRLGADNFTPAIREKFAATGVAAESAPSGHWSFPYAAHAVHRRDNWMVSIKGYNRYVWSSEIYTRDNRYGRYQSNGAIEILLPDGMKASGYQQDGWDWNRVPGATIRHLPLEELDPPSRGTTMYLSPETFTGGSTLGGRQGVFAFRLNEADKSIFKHTLVARKSIFSFDNRIIVLSTGIASSDPEHRIETVLFQNHLPTRATPVQLDAGAPITAFPADETFTSATAHVISDTVGNAFYVPKGQALRLSREDQTSRHNKTRAETRGDFASAWIDHGAKPDGAAGQFVILVQTPHEQALAFARAMRNTAIAPYVVLSQTQALHAVHDRGSGTWAYVAYDAAPAIADGPVASIEKPALVMTNIGSSGAASTPARLSVCVPDLRFPSQRNDAAGETIPILVRVQVRGLWQPDGTSRDVKLVGYANGLTTLEFGCNHALTVETTLSPRL